MVMDLFFFLGGGEGRVGLGLGWRKVNKVHYSLCENGEFLS